MFVFVVKELVRFEKLRCIGGSVGGCWDMNFGDFGFLILFFVWCVGFCWLLNSDGKVGSCSGSRFSFGLFVVFDFVFVIGCCEELEFVVFCLILFCFFVFVFLSSFVCNFFIMFFWFGIICLGV